jgi:hypothetical protein
MVVITSLERSSCLVVAEAIRRVPVIIGLLTLEALDR